MKDPLQKIFASLEESRARFVATLASLDDDQLSFRPQAESWSALEVAEHVLISEQLAVDTIVRLAGRPSRRRNLLQRLGYAMVWAALKLRFRVSAPSRVLHPSGTMTLREIRCEWDAARAKLEEVFDKLDDGALDQAGFGHPIAGPLNLREGLLFLERHTAHHLEQLDRLRHHARFPRTRAAAVGAG